MTKADARKRAIAQQLRELREMAAQASSEAEAREITSRIAQVARKYRIQEGIGLPMTPVDQAVELEPTYRRREHLDYLSDQIADAVRDVERGKSRMLAVSMPPRAGKSHLVSRYVPLWLLRRHPEWEIITASYDRGLTTEWARNIRETIEERPDLGIALKKDGGAGGRWETVEGGGMFATAVRGAATGRGARCISGDMHIQSEHGYISASEAYERRISRILAFNHESGQAEWRAVSAGQRTERRRVLEVLTEAGRVIRCTEDHPIYSGGRYVEAGQLRRGDTLVTISPHRGVPVSEVPHDAPQVEQDTVLVVRDVGSKPVTVYDFQVEGTHNFFAEGVLVHNCLIIDDPVKDFVEAHSANARQALWEWWLSVAQTRLMGPYLVLVVMTRWHADDFVGRLLSPDYAGDPKDWTRTVLPALSEGPGDLLGRAEGEPLIAPTSDETPTQAIARWSNTRSAVGEYTWASMFQQRPAPATGAIFDTSWWKFWTSDPSKARDDGTVVYIEPSTFTAGRWLDSWDCTFKGGDSANTDYVVGQRWVRNGPNRYLVAQQRGRWSFTQTIDRMRLWVDAPTSETNPAGHLVHERLIEEKANGAAIIDVLKEHVSGIKPVNPVIGKEGRARAVTPEIESGHVYLPHPGDPGNEWVNDLLGELREFPHGAHDDAVDSLTQALAGLRDPGRGRITVPGVGAQGVARGPAALLGRQITRPALGEGRRYGM